LLLSAGNDPNLRAFNNAIYSLSRNKKSSIETFKKLVDAGVDG